MSSFDVGLLLSMYIVAVHAEFDQYLDAPLLVPSLRQSHYCRIGLPTNYHYLLQETWHISSQFIATRLGTDLIGPGNIKLLNRSDPVYFWINRIVLTVQWICD